MGLPGIDDQGEGSDYPNPNQFGLRNIFGNQNIGWSSSMGTSPLSFNYAMPTVPGFSSFIPWAPMQPYGNSSMPVSVSATNGSNGENGINGTNGINGSGGNMVVSYYTAAVDQVTVNPCTEIYFQFADGDVSDDGNGKVTVTYSNGGGGGSNTIHPYKVTGATYQGGYWKYILRKQSTTLTSTFPFFQDQSPLVEVEGYNYLETSNTGSGSGGTAYGMNSNNSSSPIQLTDYPSYTMKPIPTGLVVSVMQFGSKYFFTAPNPIGGSCPS